MRAWKFYKDRQGDYLLVKNTPIKGDIYEAAAPEERGKPRSVDVTVVSLKYIARCTEVLRADVPENWRTALMEAVS